MSLKGFGSQSQGNYTLHASTFGILDSGRCLQHPEEGGASLSPRPPQKAKPGPHSSSLGFSGSAPWALGPRPSVGLPAELTAATDPEVKVSVVELRVAVVVVVVRVRMGSFVDLPDSSRLGCCFGSVGRRNLISGPGGVSFAGDRSQGYMNRAIGAAWQRLLRTAMLIRRLKPDSGMKCLGTLTWKSRYRTMPWDHTRTQSGVPSPWRPRCLLLCRGSCCKDLLPSRCAETG